MCLSKVKTRPTTHNSTHSHSNTIKKSFTGACNNVQRGTLSVSEHQQHQPAAAALVLLLCQSYLCMCFLRAPTGPSPGVSWRDCFLHWGVYRQGLCRLLETNLGSSLRSARARRSHLHVDRKSHEPCTHHNTHSHPMTYQSQLQAHMQQCATQHTLSQCISSGSGTRLKYDSNPHLSFRCWSRTFRHAPTDQPRALPWRVCIGRKG